MANSNTQTIHKDRVDNEAFLAASSMPKEPVSTSYVKPVNNISTLDATPIGEPQYDETGFESMVQTNSHQINPTENGLMDAQHITPSHAPGTVFAVNDSGQSSSTKEQIPNSSSGVSSSEYGVGLAQSTPATAPTLSNDRAIPDSLRSAENSSGIGKPVNSAPDTTPPNSHNPDSILPTPYYPQDPGRHSRTGLWLTILIILLLLAAGVWYAFRTYDARMTRLEQEQTAAEQAAKAANQTTQEQLDALSMKVTTDSVDTGDLTVTGDTNLQGGADIQGDAAVDGNTAINGNLNVTGDVTANSFQGNTNGSHAGSSSGTFQGSGSGSFSGSFSGDGSNLNNVDAETLDGQDSSFYQDAGNLNSGTLSDQRLSSNVALRNRNNQTFTGTNTFEAVTNFNDTVTAAGDIQTQNLLAGNNLSLQGGNGVIRYAQGGFATTLGFAQPTSNTSILFPALAGGNYEVCTNSGNCVGSGGSAPSGADYLTLSANPSLTNERVFGLGANLQATDGGANGAYTVSVTASPSFTNGTFSGQITAQTILQNGNSVCDDSNNCSYAAASGSANYIQNGTSLQTANFNISGNGFFGGGVGIGTTTPAQALEVIGNIQVQHNQGNWIGAGQASSIESVQSHGLILRSSANPHIIIDSDNNQANNYFAVSANGLTPSSATELLRVTDGGNVGIGTSNPQAKLQVEGGKLAVNYGANNTYVAEFKNTAAGGNGIYVQNTARTNNSDTALLVDGHDAVARFRVAFTGQLTSSAGATFGGTVTGTSLFQGANQVCDVSNNCNYAAASGSGNYIQNGTSLQTANFNISGNGYIGTSLGVGTVTPAYRLGILTAGSNTLGLATSSTSSSAAATSIDFLTSTTAVRSRIIGQRDNNSGGNIQFWTGDAAGTLTERFRVNSAGNFGIGTDTPTERLHVVGNGLFTGSITATSLFQGANQVCDNSNNCNYATSTQFSNAILQGGNSFGTTMSIGTNDTQALAFRVGGTNSMYIATDGRVGIGAGASSPDYQLQVRPNVDGIDGIHIRNTSSGASAGAVVRINTEGSGDSAVVFRAANSGTTRLWTVGVDTSDSGKFRIVPQGSITNGASIGVTVTDGSFLGVGNTSPAYRLDVNGDANLSSGFAYKINGTDICTSSGCTAAAGSGNYIQNQTASPQTAGFNISGNGTIGGSLLVQGGISSPGAGTSSEQFGAGATASGNFSLAVGGGASATCTSCIALGRNASAVVNTNSIAIGANSSAAGNALAIGSSASATNSSVAIGTGATTGSNFSGVALGQSAITTGNSGIAIGRAASAAANQLVIGSESYGATSGYFGNGVTAASPQGFTLNATGGSGTDIQGASLTLAGGRGTGTGAGGDIIFSTAAASGSSGTGLNSLTERLRVTSAGNVGIGDNNPSVRLTVKARLNAGSFGIRRSNNNDFGFLVFEDSSNNTRLDLYDSSTTNNVRLNSNGLSYLNGGNVGIGTANPSVARLEVVAGNDRVAIFNSGSITGSGDIITVQGTLARSSTNSTYGAALNLANSIAPASGASNLSFIDINGTINQSGATGITRGLYVRPTLTAAADFRGVEIANSSGYGIYQGSSGAVNYLAGNVGIGTSSPSTKLHVLAGGTLQPSYGSSTSAVIARTNAASTDAALAIISGNTGSSILKFGDTDDEQRGRIAYNHSNDSLALYSNNQERLRIDSSGNVGIGTTNPAGYRLNVSGNSNLDGYTFVSGDLEAHENVYVAENLGIGLLTANAKLHLNSTAAGSIAQIIQGASGQTADLLQARDSTDAVLARIDATGQIFQGANQVCDISNNCNYASGSGSSNYIQNGTTPQTADFNVSGTGTIGFVTISGRTISSAGEMRIAIDGTSEIIIDSEEITVRNATIFNEVGTALSVYNDASIGGTLTVGSLTQTGSFITFSNNVRGYNASVTDTSSTLAVSFATAHANANYAVMCTPNWDTTCFVSNKTASGFTLNFGTPAGPGALVDWFAPR